MVPLRIATRGSLLALAQAALVADALVLANPGITVEIVVIETLGDRVQDRSIEDLGDRGVFTRSVQVALLEDRADVAVHSFKDLPTEPMIGCQLAAVMSRADPRDALVSKDGCRLAELQKGARLGTSSARRTAQVRRARSDLSVVGLRGSVGTRVQRVHEGDLDAAVLAVAGLKRAGLSSVVTEVLDPAVFLPAPAQGALAVEVRDDRPNIGRAVAKIDHAESRIATSAERAFLRGLRGGCNAAVGALAVVSGDQVTLKAEKFDERSSGPEVLTGHINEAVALGYRAAELVLAGGSVQAS
jgi:hydroxymethylbilane synthase